MMILAPCHTRGVLCEAADRLAAPAWALEDRGLSQTAADAVGHSRRTTAGSAPKPPGPGAGPHITVTVTLPVMPLTVSVAVRV
jgi:hypothetical protein